MIGLFILGTMGAWVLLAIILGILIPHWLNLKHKVIVRIFLVPILILLPIMDEVIAYPQIKRMCKSVHGFQFVSGMSEENIHGRIVYYNTRESHIDVFPSSVEAVLYEDGYFDYSTNEPIIYGRSIAIRRGWLGMPAGSSGDKMTVILKGCSPKPGPDGKSADFILSDGKLVPKLLSASDINYTHPGIKIPFNYPPRR